MEKKLLFVIRRSPYPVWPAKNPGAGFFYYATNLFLVEAMPTFTTKWDALLCITDHLIDEKKMDRMIPFICKPFKY